MSDGKRATADRCTLRAYQIENILNNKLDEQTKNYLQKCLNDFKDSK